MESQVVERAGAKSLTPGERALLAVGALVFLAVFPFVLLDLTPRAFDQYDFRALVFPSDLGVVALLALAVRQRRLHPLAALAGIVGVTLAGAFLVHPSLRGALVLLRWSGVVAVVAVAERRVVLTCVGAWSLFESLLAFAQVVKGGPLGLPNFIENPFSFWSFGGATAPPGSLVHPYVLAGLALLGGAVLAGAARQRRGLLVAAAVAVAPVGVTYSRGALVALALVIVCFLVARFPAAALALAIGAAVPALIWSDGWAARAKTSIEAGSANDLSTARGALMRQGLDTLRDQPVVGVGPGQYVASLKTRGVDPSPSGGILKPVHNVPLLAGAEAGVLGGLAMTALLGGAGIAAWRRGMTAVAIYAALLPFCLLDHFSYTFPQGVVMFGLWLAAITTAPPRSASPTSTTS